MVLFAIGFSAWLVVDTDKKTDLSPTQTGFALDAGEDRLDLQYIKGQPLETDRLLLHVEHDGQTTEIQGGMLGLQGSWEAGEIICVVGPGCLIESAQKVTVIVGYDGAAVFRGSRTL